tara:strand:+ start:1232 stop:2014 length:783 start_codon:yes stop_codon:yes gene_type:complete
MRNKDIKNILIIGGHDPTGGAGIQADIEVSNKYKCNAFVVITCLTSQNTKNVYMVQNAKKDLVYDSIKKVCSEFKIDIIKVGLVPSISIAKEIFNAIQKNQLKKCPIILDPIIMSGSGKKLTTENTIKFIIKNLLPLTTIITPNKNEYYKYKEISKKYKIQDGNVNNIANHILITDFQTRGNKIKSRLIKKEGEIIDYTSVKKNGSYHGTGCTLSTAIACNIVNKKSTNDAVNISLKYVSKCIRSSYQRGKSQILTYRYK